MRIRERPHFYHLIMLEESMPQFIKKKKKRSKLAPFKAKLNHPQLKTNSSHTLIHNLFNQKKKKKKFMPIK